MEVYIWLGVVALSLIIEFASADLISIWFVAGGLVSMLLAAFNLPLVVQIISFIVVSALFIIFLRKPIVKLINKNASHTNADAVIGKDYTLLTPIKFGVRGSLKVNDVVWSAVGENDTDEIAEGTVVTVLEIKGNKLVVKEK